MNLNNNYLNITYIQIKVARRHGATVACLTPDQQVGGSNPSVFIFSKK